MQGGFPHARSRGLRRIVIIRNGGGTLARAHWTAAVLEFWTRSHSGLVLSAFVLASCLSLKT